MLMLMMMMYLHTFHRDEHSYFACISLITKSELLIEQYVYGREH